MKHFVTSHSSPTQIRRSHHSASRVTRGATLIECGHCQNVFSAVPRNAICLKCKRPANLPLSGINKCLSAVAFPFGLIQAAMLRASRPYAAAQALWLSILGAASWGAGYFGFLLSQG